MKIIPSKSGQFRERPYFKEGEIDRMCADELRKAGLYPKEPGPIRIDRFLEKRFSLTPTYDDLPDGVLGFTKFGAKGVVEIVIARSLDDENSVVAERRVRSTMAHEAGHGLAHTAFIAMANGSRDMFTEGPNRDSVLCRGVHGYGRYSGEWWEYQANEAIGGLLLPRDLVARALQPYLVDLGSLLGPTLDPARREKAITEMAELFNVNPAVSRIRIEGMYSLEVGGQLTL